MAHDQIIVTHTQTSQERKNILLARISGIFGALCCSYYFLFSYLQLEIARTFVLPTVAVYLAASLLNKYKWHNTAKTTLVVGTTVSLFFYGNLLGADVGAQLLLFALLPLPLLLFDIRQLGTIVAVLVCPIIAYFMLELGHYNWLPYQEIVSTGQGFFIRLYAGLTTFLLLGLSFTVCVWDSYRYELALAETNILLASNNLDLETANHQLETQKSQLKGRIAAIHDMMDQAENSTDWKEMVANIFRYQLNVYAIYTWLSETTVEKPVTTLLPYYHISDPMAQKLLYDIQKTDWNTQGISVLLPLVTSKNQIIGLVGVPFEDTLSQEDIDFLILLTKTLQRSLQFLYAAQTLKVINISESVQTHAKALRDKKITERELEIIHMIAQGFSNTTISAKLVISESTTKTHIYNIFRKLGIVNRFELLRWLNGQVMDEIV